MHGTLNKKNYWHSILPMIVSQVGVHKLQFCIIRILVCFCVFCLPQNIRKFDFCTLCYTRRVDHPNIVKLYEMYDDKSKVYLVMEL